MEVPKLIGRRDLLAGSSMSLVAPVLGTAAQAAAPERKEAPVFNLWVISDPHVGTDKAMSTAVQHGMVGFNPPPVHPESLAEALRQSENGSAIGAPPIPWDLALNLGDYAGFWDAPEDEQGREVIRQCSVLKQHRREQIYNIAGNHDASPHGAPSSEGKEANWWFRKWADPLGEHPETSLVDNAKRPYPIDGTWERYTFKFGNVRVLMMSDRNDLPYPIGRMATGGASPAGAVTAETFEWWKGQVERARANGEIIISCHHHMLRETTVGSGDFEGVEKNPDGTYRRGKCITAPTGSRRERPISISSATNRRCRPSSTIWPSIRARSIFGLVVTPIRFRTTCSMAVRMSNANGTSTSSIARNCRSFIPR